MYLVRPDISEQAVRDVLNKHNLSSQTIENFDDTVKDSLTNLKNQLGQNVRQTTPGLYDPGASIVSVGSHINILGISNPQRTPKEARQMVGLAVAKMVLHEIGHGFQLEHPTNAQGQEIISNPPRLMDYTREYINPTPASIRQPDFTGLEKQTFTRNVNEWFRTGR